jgi:ABC-type dipeptide/oligopeptide/nickel transport system permease subunit
VIGGAVLVAMTAACLISLPYTLGPAGADDDAPPRFNDHQLDNKFRPPLTMPTDEGQVGRAPLFGTDNLGRSMTVRCLLGGAISLGIGLAAAAISVVIGTGWGLISGYLGGRTDAVMMRIVDVLYGLPYILLVVLLKVALEPLLQRMFGTLAGNVITLLLAIGVVSWLTLARVVRGQVLSIKAQPFIESARAVGVPTRRILAFHMLPNLIGPIIVYTTLTVPQAILQESFLSFLGIGVQAPMPSWGNLASDGLGELNPVKSHWWRLAWPCLLLGVTLLALNFLGDGLRDRFDPRSRESP